MEQPTPKKKKVEEKENKDSKESKDSSDPNKGRYHCDYCHVDISLGVRVRCAICKNFDLCCDCFIVGVETFSHKSSHDYTVIDEVKQPIFTKSWTGDEEICLLEGIEMFGLGNWLDIADHVGTKGKLECEYHYWNVYVDNVDEQKGLVNDENINYDDLFKDEKGMFQPKSKKKPNKKRKPPVGQEVGFLYLRNDFEVEFENNAEDMIALMNISKKDVGNDLDLKEKMLEGYEFKLEEREKRKKFSVDRGFVDFKKTQLSEKKRTREERELHTKFRPFFRFCGTDEYNDFLQGLLVEKRLKEQIKQLQTYRSLGIQTNSQKEKYERDKKKRETEGRERSSYRSRSRNTDVGLLDSSIQDPEVLSFREKEICSQLKLQPKQYLIIKDACIRQETLSGILKRSALAKIMGQDGIKTSKLYDFFVSSGWIRPI